jgi:hypothetical protein
MTAEKSRMNCLAKRLLKSEPAFGRCGNDSQGIEGQWEQKGILYQDELSLIIVDMPDTLKNRQWMKKFKARWKKRLDQVEIWMVSYRIDIE